VEKLPTPDRPMLFDERRESPDSDGELNLKDIIVVLRRRKWFIGIVFGVVFVLTVIITFLSTPIYQARTKLLISTSGRSSGAGGGGSDEIPLMEYYMTWDAQRNLETQIEIMKSRPVLEEVSRRLKLADRIVRKNGNRKKSREELESSIAKMLAGVIGVESKRNADVISIKAQWPDPELARDLANTTADVYIEESRKLNQEVAASARRFVEEQLTVSKLELDNAERAMRRFKEKTGITDLKEEIKEKVSQAAKVEAQAIDTEAALRSARAKLGEIREQIRKSDPSFISGTTISNNPIVLGQQQRIAELEVKKAGLLEEFGSKHPEVISVDNQIASAKSSIKKSMADIVSSRVKAPNPLYLQLYSAFAETQAQVFGLEATLSAFNNVIDMNRREFTTLPRKEQDLANLERGREVAAKTYMMLLEKYQNLRIAEVSKLGNARVIETAETLNAPIKPRKQQNLLMGMLLGLFLGCLGAFGLEYLDDTVKNQDDLEGLVRLPTLGAIPLFKEDELEKIFSPQGGTPEATDGFRMIRSNVRFFALDRPLSTIMVTSAVPGEGKTTITVNLAVASAQGEKKVIIIDADIRKSSLHKYFKLPRTPGLTNILAEDLDLASAIQHTSIASLDLISGGSTSPNPVELLESQRMQKLLAELKKRYDYIIIDTPPMGTMPDAVVLSSTMDGVLLVVAANATPKPQLQKMIRILTFSKARVLGTILNKIDYRKHGDYYYYYSYRYKYGEDAEKDGGKGKRKK
jgi:polysaccharide biosynthesis transport protein